MNGASPFHERRICERRYPHAGRQPGLAVPDGPTSGMKGRIVQAWRWCWFLAVRNRFVIAVASLIWLVWRSGSQPRRLAYPCQQAAAANLGVFAVLVVPALARRRKARHGRALPPAVQLATGSVALAGVLFVLISAGVAVYSDFSGTLDYSPGNPAMVPWPKLTEQDLAVPDYGLSAHVFAPNADEAVVAINRNDAVSYGGFVAPYSAGPNSAYQLVWQTVADLHLGPPGNPLGDLLADVNGPNGQPDGEISVVLKPNWVEYYNVRGGVGDPEGRSPAYTNAAMMPPLVEMAVRAGATQIVIGDSSGEADNDAVTQMGYQELINWLVQQYPGVNIVPYPVNFQNVNKFTWARLSTGAGGGSVYAGSGYTSSDLSKAHLGGSGSYFGATDSHGTSGPGAANCIGAYAVTDYLLDADLIVDVPKVKVHFYGINTMAMKNWVGTTMLSTGGAVEGGCRIAHEFDSPASLYENCFGNDIMWRELVDLHRVFVYWDRTIGGLRPTPKRKYLCVLDAIVCGETDLYYNGGPTHWRANTVLASVDPVALDAVGSRLQRYRCNYEYLPPPNEQTIAPGGVPIISNANVPSNWPIGTSDPGKLRVVGAPLSDVAFGIDQTFNHVSIFDDNFDQSQTWPDWNATVINDLTPPAINSATAQDNGDGTWDVQANISNGHVAFYYYGDDGSGTPRVVRLGKSGDTFSAMVSGSAGTGVFVAQDKYFNTASAEVVNTPVIQLSTHELTQTFHYTENPDNDTFTVANIGIGTLNYGISIEYTPGDDPWLEVDPDDGESTGEADPITVIYDCSSLLPGTHLATIAVSDPAASNDPQRITVTANVQTVKPDLDQDGDVDQEDFGLFQVCTTGGGSPVTNPDCFYAKFDADSDIDRDDLAILQRCLSGPKVIANKTCDDL